MYERWCDTCEKPMKCHNDQGNLFCVGCKSLVGAVDATAPTA